MKRFNKFLALFLAVVLTVGMLPAAVSAEEYPKVILDEDFENATSLPLNSGDLALNHVVYYNAGEATITDGAVKLTATAHTNTDWHLSDWGMGKVQVSIAGSKFEVGATYTVRAKYKSSHATTSNGLAGVRATITAQDYPYSGNIIVNNVFIGQEWTVLENTFVMTEALSAKNLVFKFGSDYYLPADTTEDTYKDYYLLIDDISITKVVPYGYETVVEELEAGNATLQTDVDGTGNDLIVKTGKTLDLAGYTLTVDSLSAMPGAKVIDSVGTGKIVVANDNLTLQADNGMIPIKTNAGYVLSNVKLTNNELEDDGLDDIMVYETRPSLGAANNAAYLADGAADNGLSIIIRLTWTNASNGTTTTMDVPCSEELIKDIYGGTGAFRLLVKGVDGVENLKVATVITSTTGVTCVSDFCDYVAPVA